MMGSKHKSGKPQKTARHIWAELADICGKIRVRLYGRDRDKRSARRYLQRLELIMRQLPENDLAILRHEGAALLAELENDYSRAIQHRKKEIELTERAQKSVQESVRRGDYDARTAARILQGRDSKGLKKRQAILRTLEEQMNAYQQRDGISSAGPQAEKTSKQKSLRRHFMR